MFKILLLLVVLAVLAFIVMGLMSYFSAENRAARTANKADKFALTSARQRSNLAERALREIAAGAEYPIFVAEDALRQINNTYDNKEIA